MTGGTALHQIGEGHDKCLLRAGRLGRARSGTRSLAGPTILRKSCTEASGRMSCHVWMMFVVVKRSVLRIPRGIAHCCATKAGGVVCQLPRIMTARQTGLQSLCGGGRRGMRLVCSVDRRLATALQYFPCSRRVAREPLETPRNPCPSDAAAAAYSTVRTLSIESHNDEGRHACQPTPRACPTTACAIADRSLRICRPV